MVGADVTEELRTCWKCGVDLPDEQSMCGPCRKDLDEWSDERDVVQDMALSGSMMLTDEDVEAVVRWTRGLISHYCLDEVLELDSDAAAADLIRRRVRSMAPGSQGAYRYCFDGYRDKKGVLATTPDACRGGVVPWKVIAGRLRSEMAPQATLF